MSVNRQMNLTEETSTRVPVHKGYKGRREKRVSTGHAFATWHATSLPLFTVGRLTSTFSPVGAYFTLHPQIQILPQISSQSTPFLNPSSPKFKISPKFLNHSQCRPIAAFSKMENINEPHPTVPEVTEPTVQTAGNDQVQPPTEEPVAGVHVEATAPSTIAFSIQDLVHHDPEQESGESVFISYTGYWRKQTRPSKFVGKEGTVQEQEGDPSQGSNQEETAQAAEESVVPRSDEPPHEAQDQGTVVADEGEKGETEEPPQKKQEPEPLKESTTLQKGGEEAILKEVDLGHPIVEEESSTESEASEDLRRKVETRRKARTLLSIEPQEQERQAVEKCLADEKKRKGKGIAAPSPCRSRRQASRTMTIQEPEEKKILLEVSTDDEEETTLSDDRREKYEPFTVEVGDHTKKIVSTFDDEEDQAIYKLKTDATMRNRIHQSVHLESLDALGVRKKFVQYLCKISFGWFLQLGILEVPLMLAEEFFTTFRFTTTTDLDKPTISFRLLGLEFEMNISEWAVMLGVATVSEVGMSHWKRMERGVHGKHITFDGKKEWKKVAREGASVFSANKSLGADIKDPILRLAQIYLGFNLFGQSTCVTRVSLTELYFMRKMQKGENVNLAFWLAYQAQ